MESDIDGQIEGLFDAQNCTLSAESQLSVGTHLIQATVVGQHTETAEHLLKVCPNQYQEDFDHPLDEDVWKLYGTALQSSNGWIELTGNSTFSEGKIFNLDHVFAPSSLHVSFRIQTGPVELRETIIG